MNTEVEEVLTNIRKLRESRRLSQENIASELGIDGSTYSKIENGKIDLTYERLAELANIFGLRTIDLITYPSLYVDEVERPEEKKIKAILQLELTREKKDQILKLVFGDNNIEILNR